MIKATLSFHIWSLSMHPVDWQVQSLLILLSLGSWQVLGQVDLKCFFVIILSLPKPRNDNWLHNIVKSVLMLFYARPFLRLTASSLVCGISINADISTSSKTFFHVFSSLVLPLKWKNFGKLISWTFERKNKYLCLSGMLLSPYLENTLATFELVGKAQGNINISIRPRFFRQLKCCVSIWLL